MRGEILQLSVLLLLLSASISHYHIIDYQVSESLYSGPYLDSIRYTFIEGEDQLFLAITDNEIDMIGDSIDPNFVIPLEDSSIEVSKRYRNGYGYMALNCEKYPFNISEFRQAIAYAIDKELICDDIWDGLASPHDSLLPRNNPFSIEGSAPISYYEDNNESAITIFDSLGFLDTDSDGFRELPNGSEFDVRIDYASTSNMAAEICQLFEQTLQSLDINATAIPYDWYIYPTEYPEYFEDFDMVFASRNFPSFDLRWMKYPNPAVSPVFGINVSWSNSSYDEWANQLTSSVTYTEVEDAAAEMQKIWLEECPLIICYQNHIFHAHRTDRFTGFVNDALSGIPDFWTNYRVRLNLKPLGQQGGTLRWGLPLEPDTFNPLVSSSQYTWDILDMLYDSLMKRSPSGNTIPWLAANYTFTTFEDNQAIPEGHCQIAFDILDNATWSNGDPLTAEDIRDSLLHYRNSYYFDGTPLMPELQPLVAAYTLATNQLVLEFNTTSYWHLYTVGYKPILHSLSLQQLGLEDWHDWKPAPQADEYVTSGPFVVDEFVPGEYILLIRNPSYFYQPALNDTASNDSSGFFGISSLQQLAIFGTLATVTIAAVVIIIRRKEDS
ncbi:hypothetical protein EU537_04895 [Candidatus Thorarchaeota archaeon]|nr:MAG: hypothetical protein EU537_04895 [Candidatus Thorarchaeota archaeon]